MFSPNLNVLAVTLANGISLNVITACTVPTFKSLQNLCDDSSLTILSVAPCQRLEFHSKPSKTSGSSLSYNVFMFILSVSIRI